MSAPTTTVQADSLLTLNYRIALPSGQPLVSTFESSPATLKLGVGEMLPALERVLLGLPVGPLQTFELGAEQAFGPYREELLERVRRQHMPDDVVEPMSVMEFTAPDGSRYSGLVREIDDESALIDFNHPLAGKSIRFDVQIISIL